MHIRYELPDVVLEQDITVESGRLWMSHATVQESAMIAAEGIGSFVRALLPVHLTGGYTVTFGVWVVVPTEEMHRALSEWFSPWYPRLVIDGHLANEIAPWSVSGAPTRISVIDPDHIPYVTSSPNHEMTAVLQCAWNHKVVLSSLPR